MDIFFGLLLVLACCIVLIFICLSVWYILVFPYWLAKRIRITKNFIFDCLLSYFLSWAIPLFIGNILYVLIAMTKENKTQAS